MGFRRFNQAGKADTPQFASATARQAQLENAEDARIASLRSQNTLGAGALYNKGMGDKSPISDFISDNVFSQDPSATANYSQPAGLDAPIAEGGQAPIYEGGEVVNTGADAFSAGLDAGAGDVLQGAELVEPAAEAVEGVEALQGLTEGAEIAEGVTGLAEGAEVATGLAEGAEAVAGASELAGLGSGASAAGGAAGAAGSGGMMAALASNPIGWALAAAAALKGLDIF